MPTPLFGFTDPSAANAWHAIDDRVMGGISRSTLRHDQAGHALFEGTVSLERNGGFAAVRSSPGERGLSGAGTCLIDLRGDNKQLKLSLLTDDGFDSLNHQASSAPTGPDWQTLHLPLADLRASFCGREVTDTPALVSCPVRLWHWSCMPMRYLGNGDTTMRTGRPKVEVLLTDEAASFLCA
jgi:NADH dehydrogenase [ubiquinone] 1 alpha subcomplex assembly factor 1